MYLGEINNPKKMKHRNRICTLIEVEDHLLPSWGIVKFHDTKRNGKIDSLSDLKSYKS
jgi:hypothetical protein